MNRRWLLASVVILPLLTGSRVNADDITVRWDIANFEGSPTVGIFPGASLSQCLGDSSPIITLTGSGTFKLNGSGKPTGGGEWTIAGLPESSGTYAVTDFVSFEEAPDSLVPSGYIDNIGNLADARGGVAVLRILYSDGDQGVLVVIGTVRNEGTFYVSKGYHFYGFPACLGPTDNYPLGFSPIFHITVKPD